MNLEEEIEKCNLKTKYESKNIAFREGKLYFGFKEFNVYQCPYCGK